MSKSVNQSFILCSLASADGHSKIMQSSIDSDELLPCYNPEVQHQSTLAHPKSVFAMNLLICLLELPIEAQQTTVQYPLEEVDGSTLTVANHSRGDFKSPRESQKCNGVCGDAINCVATTQHTKAAFLRMEAAFLSLVSCR